MKHVFHEQTPRSGFCFCSTPQSQFPTRSDTLGWSPWSLWPEGARVHSFIHIPRQIEVEERRLDTIFEDRQRERLLRNPLYCRLGTQSKVIFEMNSWLPQSDGWARAPQRARAFPPPRGGCVLSGGAVSFHWPLVLPGVANRKWKGQCTEKEHVFVLTAKVQSSDGISAKVSK